jgi:excisionase family DNA binding protein
MNVQTAKNELLRFLTVKELAQMLRVKVLTVYSWVENDLIPYHKAGRITVFRLDEVLTWPDK